MVAELSFFQSKFNAPESSKVAYESHRAGEERRKREGKGVRERERQQKKTEAKAELGNKQNIIATIAQLASHHCGCFCCCSCSEGLVAVFVVIDY